MYPRASCTNGKLFSFPKERPFGFSMAKAKMKFYSFFLFHNYFTNVKKITKNIEYYRKNYSLFIVKIRYIKSIKMV